jgi:hypothetical protein
LLADASGVLDALLATGTNRREALVALRGSELVPALLDHILTQGWHRLTYTEAWDLYGGDYYSEIAEMSLLADLVIGHRPEDAAAIRATLDQHGIPAVNLALAIPLREGHADIDPFVFLDRLGIPAPGLGIYLEYNYWHWSLVLDGAKGAELPPAGLRLGGDLSLDNLPDFRAFPPAPGLRVCHLMVRACPQWDRKLPKACKDSLQQMEVDDVEVDPEDWIFV